MKILKSLSDDPVRNLELERELLTERHGDFLLLYINRSSVIVGRNQSPEAEADLEYCRRNGIPVLQRISGGGTVYHDHGNINYSFITARGKESLLDSKPHRHIIDILEGMGIEAIAGPRGELTVDGLKISGTASYVTSTRQLFHGTLLFDTDLGKMERALAGNPSRRGPKIASVPSKTANLKALFPQFPNPKVFFDTLADTLAGHFGAMPPEDITF